MIPHRRTEHAGDEAAAIGVPADDVAKTVILATANGYVRAVLPASRRLDLHKARRLLGGGNAHPPRRRGGAGARLPDVRARRVPPFGGPAGDRVIVDRRLAMRDSVVLEAGSHIASLRMKTSDLLDVAEAEFGNLAAD